MKIEWTPTSRRAFDTFVPEVKSQIIKSVDMLRNTQPGNIQLDLKRYKQLGAGMFTFRISREVRGILERTYGGYLLVDIVRRGDRRYYSNET
jgi:hypothetical protein